MEDVSLAYLQALCASNGYTMEKAGRDNDGVDVKVSCKGKPADDSKRTSPTVEVQLKATFSKFNKKTNGNYSFKLEAKNYNKLIDPYRFNPIILVVLHMERERNLWVQHTDQHLLITKCAYWLSLKGCEPKTNRNSISIEIPNSNILSCEALKEIMIKAAREEDL